MIEKPFPPFIQSKAFVVYVTEIGNYKTTSTTDNYRLLQLHFVLLIPDVVSI